MATRQGSIWAKNGTSRVLVSRFLRTVFPSASTLWTWKTALAQSRPITAISFMDVPPHSGLITPSQFGAAMPQPVGASMSLETEGKPRCRRDSLW